MKSGIKSTGDNAYATVTPDNILAGLGVSISFKAKNKAGISVFNFFAFTLKSIYKTTSNSKFIYPYYSHTARQMQELLFLISKIMVQCRYRTVGLQSCATNLGISQQTLSRWQKDWK